MKLKKLPIWALALAVLAGSSCSSDDYNYTKDGSYGTLSFALAANNQLNEGEISRAESRASGLTISEALGGNAFNATSFLSSKGGDFAINVKDSNYETTNCLLKEWDASKSLAFGNYTVNASYDQAKVGFYGDGGEPAFESEEVSFTIATADAPTAVSIPVSMSNSIMRVRYTEMFKNYYADCTTVVTQTGKSPVTFTYTEERGAFFEAANATIKYTLTPSQAQGENGNAIEKSVSQTLSAKTCHTLLFDVTNVGGVNKLTITLDDTTITEVEIGDIDLNDDQYKNESGSNK